jgi:hypothetical protein
LITKNLLTSNEIAKIWYFDNDVKVHGPHSNITGDVTNISGDVTIIYGNVSHILGNVSNIFGNVSRIRGNIDKCNVTQMTNVSDLFLIDL